MGFGGDSEVTSASGADRPEAGTWLDKALGGPIFLE